MATDDLSEQPNMYRFCVSPFQCNFSGLFVIFRDFITQAYQERLLASLEEDD